MNGTIQHCISHSRCREHSTQSIQWWMVLNVAGSCRGISFPLALFPSIHHGDYGGICVATKLVTKLVTKLKCINIIKESLEFFCHHTIPAFHMEENERNRKRKNINFDQLILFWSSGSGRLFSSLSKGDLSYLVYYFLELFKLLAQVDLT